MRRRHEQIFCFLTLCTPHVENCTIYGSLNMARVGQRIRNSTRVLVHMIHTHTQIPVLHWSFSYHEKKKTCIHLFYFNFDIYSVPTMFIEEDHLEGEQTSETTNHLNSILKYN